MPKTAESYANGHFSCGTDDVALIVGSGALARAVAAELTTRYQVVMVDDCADKLCKVQIDNVLAAVAGMGPLKAFVYASTVWPERLSVQEVLRRALYGTSLWIEQCAEHIAPAGAAVTLACVTGHWARINSDDESALGHVPASDLLDLPFLSPDNVGDPLAAYRLAQRGIQMRVRAAATGWAAQRQARINSVSGGDGAHRYPLAAIDAGVRCPGADDIAGVTRYLLSRHTRYVCGTDVPVDNGANAAHWARVDAGDTFDDYQPVACRVARRV